MSSFRSVMCRCLRVEREVNVLDYRHCSLEHVPSDAFVHERTLEELYVDSNQIRDLPRELFFCLGLRKLSVSDNDITSIPPAITNLSVLEELIISRNGIVDIPENIKTCKHLRVIEASVNPFGKFPDGFTQLPNLSELYLNDTFLDYLPGSFGRLNKLKVLEMRENHLKTLPNSMSRLTLLERLDIGQNDFTELPEVIGSFTNLLELWCDMNKITKLTPEIGNLKQLMYLDASKNRIEDLPSEIDGCVALADLYLSTNMLERIPQSIGKLSSLTTLKLDDNRLLSLPNSLGGLVSLSELTLSTNDLEDLPSSLGMLRHLRTLYADENFLLSIPPEIGSCSGLTILSLRSNKLTTVPEELGRIPHLRVLNLSDNKLQFLPFSFTRLKELQALWLAENQTRPLVPLQSEVVMHTGQRVLTCYLLPQQSRDDSQEEYNDTTSFHPSLWEEERLQRQQIQFDVNDEDYDDEGKLSRTPTPFPKEMKVRAHHMKNLAIQQRLMNLSRPLGISPNTNKKLSGGYRAATDLLGFGPSPVVDGPSLASASPLVRERHLLLKADKEKMFADKSRLSQHGRPVTVTPAVMPVRMTSPNVMSTNVFTQEPGLDKRQVNQWPEYEARYRESRECGDDMESNWTAFESTRKIANGGKNSIPTNSISPPVPRLQSPQTGFSYEDFKGDLMKKPPTVKGQGSTKGHHKTSKLAREQGYESDTACYKPTRQKAKGSGYMSDGQVGKSGPASTRGSSKPGFNMSIWYNSDGRNGYASDGQPSGRGLLSNGDISRGGAYDRMEYVSRTQSSAGRGGYGNPQQGNGWGYESGMDYPAKVRGHQFSRSGYYSDNNSGSYDKGTGRRGNEIAYSSPPNSYTVGSSSQPARPVSVGTWGLYGGPEAGPVAGQTPVIGRRAERGNSNAYNTLNGYYGDDKPVKNFWNYDANGDLSRKIPNLEGTNGPGNRREYIGNNVAVVSIYSNIERKQNDVLCNKSVSPISQANRPKVDSIRSQTISPEHHQNLSQPTPTHLLPPNSISNSGDSMVSKGNSKLCNPLESISMGEKGIGEVAVKVVGDVKAQERKFAASADLLIATTHATGSNGSQQPSPASNDTEVVAHSNVSGSIDSGYEQAHDATRESQMLIDKATPYGSTLLSQNAADNCREAESGGRLTVWQAVPRDNLTTKPNVFAVTIFKNPGLGFSIAGGIGSPGNPFRPGDTGIFVTRVQTDGPAGSALKPADKILEANGTDLRGTDHATAVSVLVNSARTVSLVVERL